MGDHNEKTRLLPDNKSTSTVATSPATSVHIEQVPQSQFPTDAIALTTGLPDENQDVSQVGALPAPQRQRKRDPSVTVYHCHAENEPGAQERALASNMRARKTLVLATAICMLFMFAEIAGGWIANSLAIITDAAHLLTDVAGFLISLFSLYVATLSPTKKMNFGWHRAEVLGALVSVLSIWVITGILVYLAVQRIITAEYEIDAPIMFITAAVGVLVNIIMGILLYYGGGGHGHSHGGLSHGHSHGNGNGKKGKAKAKRVEAERSDDEMSGPMITMEDGTDLRAQSPMVQKQEQAKNINVRAAFVHVIGDLFQSLGVLVAAAVIYFVPSAKIADPICTFLFSILVLITTLTILRDVTRVLMEGIPRGVQFAEVLESLETIEGVRVVHNLRIWALTMDKVAVSVHLGVDGTRNAQSILTEASLALQSDYGVYESTIQIERMSDSMSECPSCHPLSTASGKGRV